MRGGQWQGKETPTCSIFNSFWVKKIQLWPRKLYTKMFTSKEVNLWCHLQFWEFGFSLVCLAEYFVIYPNHKTQTLLPKWPGLPYCKTRNKIKKNSVLGNKKIKTNSGFIWNIAYYLLSNAHWKLLNLYPLNSKITQMVILFRPISNVVLISETKICLGAFRLEKSFVPYRIPNFAFLLYSDWHQADQPVTD